MSEAKHTPGPWGSDSEYGTAIIGADGTTVASVLNSINATKRQHPVPQDVEQVKANARLIVSAPELLAALKKAESYIDRASGGGETDLRAELNAVVAKAEGRL